MTLLDDDVTVTTSARPATTPRDAWRAAKVPVLVTVLILATGVLLAVLTGSPGLGPLYPDSARPEGGRALAELLRDRGIDVQRTALFSGRGGQTVFVPLPELVDPDDLGNLGGIVGPADVVLVGPEDEQIESLGARWVRARAGSVIRPVNIEPACAFPAAEVAGVARGGGFLYTVADAAAECYSSRGLPSLVVFERRGVRVTLVGAPDLFTNERLAEQGNAALALGLLSRYDRVEWLQPRLAELGRRDGDGATIGELLPRGVTWAVLQLLLAALVAIAWRARRLGPVVTEPLPIAVRAAEAVEGRARLYQAGQARERAAASLRTAVRLRLARRLGLTHDAERSAVIPVVAARSTRPPTAVDLLLYGPPPADDEALVRLADELDSLDNEVR